MWLPRKLYTEAFESPSGGLRPPMPGAVVFLDGTVKNGAAEIMQLKERLWQLEGGVR